MRRRRIPKPLFSPRRRPGACGVREAAASACHDTLLGATAPGTLCRKAENYTMPPDKSIPGSVQDWLVRAKGIVL